MSSPIITVENISKSYILKHQNNQGYTALRDVIANSAKNIFNSRQKSSNSASEEFWAIKDVSFEVQQGDRIGIIGRNGAGKSTLLKILSRIVTPTKGRITIDGRIASLLEVGTGFHPELSGRENIFLNGSILGMSKSEIQKKFDEIVDFAEVERFLDTPVKRYSSGMYVRLAFAVAAHLEPEILIVDEVLAVGDAEFQKKCLGKMQDVSGEGRTVLFVSHNMAAIKQLCNNGILLNQGKVVTTGKINEVIESYQNHNEGASAELDDYNKRKGSGLCRVTSVKLMSESGQIKSFFKLGEKLKIVLSIKNCTASTVEKLRIIIGVYNSMNEGFLRFDSKNSNVTFDCKNELLEVTCLVNEHLNIKPDFYSLNIALLQNETMIDHVSGVSKFSIENFDYFETGRDIEDAGLAKVYYKHSWLS